MTYDKETATEIFRRAVLEAMDEAAERIFGISVPKNHGGIGATDADLPELFKGVDAQLGRLSVRFNHPLHENWVGSSRYFEERRFLSGLGIKLIEDEATH